MPALVIALVLFVQSLAPDHGYIQWVDVDTPILVTHQGRFGVALSDDCSDFMASQNVDLYPGSDNVIQLAQPGSDPVCNALYEERVSPRPCALGLNGECDINAEGTYQPSEGG